MFFITQLFKYLQRIGVPIRYQNTDDIDKMVNNIKAVLFAKYLGLNVKTAVLNTTQNMEQYKSGD